MLRLLQKGRVCPTHAAEGGMALLWLLQKAGLELLVPQKAGLEHLVLQKAGLEVLVMQKAGLELLVLQKACQQCHRSCGCHDKVELVVAANGEVERVFCFPMDLDTTFHLIS